MRRRAGRVMVVAAMLAMSPAAVLFVRAEETLAAVDADLQKAKQLYEGASFTEAVTLLQSALRRLEVLRSTQARVQVLGDAYLHLALAQLGAGQRGDAKDAFRRLVRLDPKRQLDPDVFAPKVRALLEEARAEVAGEGRDAAALPSAPARSSKRGALFIAGGAVSAAAAGAAVAFGVGSSAAPPPSTPPLESSDIEFASSDPAPGSTIRLFGTAPITVRLWIVHPESGDFSLSVNEIGEDGRTRYCLTHEARVTLRGGEPQLSPVHVQRRGACLPPFEIAGWEVWLRRLPSYDSGVFRIFPVRYSVTP
jgi:hypothetical protein